MSKKNEKIDPKALAKELLNDRTHGAAKAGAGELQKADAFAEGYKAFMNAAKTERETVTWAVQAAEAAGFEPLRPMVLQQPGQGIVPGGHWQKGREEGCAHCRGPHRQPPHRPEAHPSV